MRSIVIVLILFAVTGCVKANPGDTVVYVASDWSACAEYIKYENGFHFAKVYDTGQIINMGHASTSFFTAESCPE